jgi:hypothetical protein
LSFVPGKGPGAVVSVSREEATFDRASSSFPQKGKSGSKQEISLLTGNLSGKCALRRDLSGVKLAHNLLKLPEFALRNAAIP